MLGVVYWRAASVSARTFREAAIEVGMSCVAQEVVNWIGHNSEVERHVLPGEYVPLTDCFSTVKQPVQRGDRCAVTRVYINRDFVQEWRQVVDLSRLYYRCEARQGAPGSLRQESRAERVPRVWRGLRCRMVGWLFSVREPLARSVARKRCPDCADELSYVDDVHECRSCHVAYLLR